MSFSSAGEAPCVQVGPQMWSCFRVMASLLAKVVGVDVKVQCSLEAAGGLGLVRRRTKTCRGRCSHAMALPAAAPRGHSPALMLDDLRRFSTDAFPEALRQSALDEVLGRALVRSE